MKAYDYIIVGAGSAGCTLANRLTEDADARVLIIEAGGWDRDPWIHIPLGWGKILQQRRHDWMYFSEPEQRLNGRRDRVRARQDCRRLVGDQRDGLLPRSSAGLRPLGGGRVRPAGPMPTCCPTFAGRNPGRAARTPIAAAMGHWRRAHPTMTILWWKRISRPGQAAGYPVTEDYNGADPEGFGRLQMTIRNGWRCSASTAYLRPALGRAQSRRVGQRSCYAHRL